MVIKFYDGREGAIHADKMAIFDKNSVYYRLYKGEQKNLTSVIEEIGPCALDFTNIHGGSEDIPDIDSRSTRLFTIWGEYSETGDVVGLVRGLYLLLPFITHSPPDWIEYYSLQDNIPYYPIAVITSFRTIALDEETWDEFISQMLEQMSTNWQKLRSNTISRLQQGSDLWKRYVLSFEQIIHFTFTCPSIDREIIDALKKKGFRITGFLQLLSSSSPFYGKAAINHHIHSAQKIINNLEKDV